MAKSIKTTSWNDPFYAPFFYGLIKGLQPNSCVELGTYAGYSAYHIASALKSNGHGKLDCYDLWGKYPYNHVDISEARKNLKGLPASLHQEEALVASIHYGCDSVDFMLVDVSNDGKTYKYVLESWYGCLRKRAMVLMEGGIKERDEVGWMQQYEKTPILPILKDGFINKHYKVEVINHFPGLTIFTKR